MTASNQPLGDDRDFVPEKTYGLYRFINRHPWSIAGVLVVLAAVLSALFPTLAAEEEPSFDPKGPIYDTRDRVEEVFASSSSVRDAIFIVENPDGGDVLTRDALLELKQNQAALLADAEAQSHFATTFDRDLGIEMVGVFSVADAVDAALPGGLEAASEADVKKALADLLADEAPTSGLRFLLSPTSTGREPTVVGDETIVVWESPAFFARVIYDIDSFDAPSEESFGEESNLDAEAWLRDVQITLRGDQQSVTAIGLAIDQGSSVKSRLSRRVPTSWARSPSSLCSLARCCVPIGRRCWSLAALASR